MFDHSRSLLQFHAHVVRVYGSIKLEEAHSLHCRLNMRHSLRDDRQEGVMLELSTLSWASNALASRDAKNPVGAKRSLGALHLLRAQIEFE